MNDTLAQQITHATGFGLDRLKQIFDGWRYLLFPDQAVERLALERSEVCGRCPHNTGTKCGKCGCPLRAKIRSPESTCPDGRWAR